MAAEAEPDWLDSLRRQGEQLMRQSQLAQEQLSELSESATSTDGAVTVTVGASGALRDVVLTDAAMRNRAGELSALIIRLAGQAQGAAARRAMEVVEPFAGEEGMDFLRSQLPEEQAEDSGAAQGGSAGLRSRADDEDEVGPPESFLRPRGDTR